MTQLYLIIRLLLSQYIVHIEHYHLVLMDSVLIFHYTLDLVDAVSIFARSKILLNKLSSSSKVPFSIASISIFCNSFSLLNSIAFAKLLVLYKSFD